MFIFAGYPKFKIQIGNRARRFWIYRRLLFWFGAIILLAHTIDGAQAAIVNDSELQFSHNRGFYREPFELTISTLKSSETILFTTNGSRPTLTSGKVYEGRVTISTTTVLRASIFRNGVETAPSETRSFIFPGDVSRQTGAGFPANWGTREGKPVRAFYEMNSKFPSQPDSQMILEDSLTAIPSLSILMEPEDLFGADRGIYSHPMENGSNWERAASVELIFAGERKGFQANCGVRIQGGWNRRPEESPKHSFRLVFKKKYGVAKLKFPLFGEGISEFETLILRGGNNNSWLHWSGEERRRGDYIRDQWMRDSYRAMGHPSARGFFVHLYLNGLYWGVYNLTERPSAPFAAAHFGGSAKDYDSRNGEHILEGDDVAWEKMFALANSGLKSGAHYDAMEEMLDLPSFIDFMILNFYGANADWDRASNWYAARRRKSSGKFYFFVWDGERTLEKWNDNTISGDDDQSPLRLFQKLRENEGFRHQFGERIRQHLSGTGVLTPEPSARRFASWAETLDKAIIAESARWGSYRRDVHSFKVGPYERYTREDHWRREINRLLTEYFPKRTAEVLKQFHDAGLYPHGEP